MLRNGVKVEEELVLTTDDSSRKYLMGMDEKHLFICQIPETERVVNKVVGAHRGLKPKEIRGAKEKRQGEFFFVEVKDKVYVKGKIRHPEHSTINLLTWHRVHKNAEVDMNANRDKPDMQNTAMFLHWID